MKLQDTGYNPNLSDGRKAITTAARIAAGKVFHQDWGIQEIIRDNDVMRTIATTECNKWMENSLLQKLEDYPHSEIFDLLRRTFVAGFRKEYRERIKWIEENEVNTEDWEEHILPGDDQQESSQEKHSGARIVTTRLEQDVPVYMIEIMDHEHLSAPIQVEIAVNNEDDIGIQEVRDDDG
jgi:hypothetical protein